jgi:hypothetical protein
MEVCIVRSKSICTWSSFSCCLSQVWSPFLGSLQWWRISSSTRHVSCKRSPNSRLDFNREPVRHDLNRHRIRVSGDWILMMSWVSNFRSPVITDVQCHGMQVHLSLRGSCLDIGRLTPAYQMVMWVVAQGNSFLCFKLFWHATKGDRMRTCLNIVSNPFLRSLESASLNKLDLWDWNS